MTGFEEENEDANYGAKRDTVGEKGSRAVGNAAVNRKMGFASGVRRCSK